MDKVIWMKHYSSSHEILLVGEGDFSFSLSLANAFGSASNIVATSLDSYDVVVVKYAKAKAHLESLERMGATILHEVDATNMKLHSDLKMRKFDRIVFNFPHAGFKGKETKIINLHRKLVQGFFKNASHMLRPYGEVHVSHKMGGPFRKWNLKELASKNFLILVKCSNFRIGDYPGYSNKRGDGARCDQPFPLGACCTFKFRIGDVQKMKKACKNMIAATSSIDCTYGRRGTHATEIEDHLRSTSRVNHPVAIKNPQDRYLDDLWGSSQPAFVEDHLRSTSRVNHLVAIKNPQDLYLDDLWGSSQPAFAINVDRTPARDFDPPRIGFSSVYLRSYGNHVEDVGRLIARYGPDFARYGPDLSYVNQGNARNAFVNEMNGACGRTIHALHERSSSTYVLSSFRQVNSPEMLFGTQEGKATPIQVTSRALWY